MLALVINLPHSKARLAFQTKQLNTLGIEYKVLTAIGVDTVQESEFKRLAGTWQRLMRRTEVACFMSHLKAWNKVLTLGQPCLILEDDAFLSACTPKLLSHFQGLSNCDLITLENRSRKKIISKKTQSIVCHSNLLALYQDRTGAAAYVLWPSAANKLIQKYQTNKIGLADAFISSCYAINAFQVEPAAAIQLDQCAKYQIGNPHTTESIITPEQTKHPTPVSKSEAFKFKLKRAGAQLSMGFRQLSVLHKSERRFIQIRKSDFEKSDL